MYGQAIYVVIFTLPGFRTFRRDGIVLQAGFAATVDADMSLGTIEETDHRHGSIFRSSTPGAPAEQTR